MKAATVLSGSQEKQGNVIKLYISFEEGTYQILRQNFSLFQILQEFII